MTVLMLAVSAVLVAFDFQNVLSWWRGRVIPVRTSGGSDDYTIVVPLYGHPRYFTNPGRALPFHEAERALLRWTSPPPVCASTR